MWSSAEDSPSAMLLALAFGAGSRATVSRRLEEAVASYRAALSLRSTFSEAHNDLGNALKALKRLDEAVTTWATP